MATDPPYLVDYDGGNHPQTWDKDGTADQLAGEDHATGTPTPTRQAAAAFYESFLACRPDEALTRAARRLPVVCHDARSDWSLGPGSRSACWPTRC